MLYLIAVNSGFFLRKQQELLEDAKSNLKEEWNKYL